MLFIIWILFIVFSCYILLNTYINGKWWFNMDLYNYYKEVSNLIKFSKFKNDGYDCAREYLENNKLGKGKLDWQY